MKTNYYSTELTRNLKRLTILTIFVLFLNSCVESDKTQKNNIHGEMISLMDTLQDAAIKIDADRIVNMCSDNPEFLFFSDGSVMNYEQFVKDVRDSYHNFADHQLTWDSLYVKVLSPDVVSALAYFHQKITTKDGTIIQLEGEVTWIANRTEGGLKLIYGHAGHRPDTTYN